MNKYIVTLLSISLSSVAQLLLKKGAAQAAGFDFASVMKLFTNLNILLGLSGYAASAVLWIYVLNRMKLSIAYPLASLGYIFTSVLAVLFLDEKISGNQIAGLLLIIAGVVVLVR